MNRSLYHLLMFSLLLVPLLIQSGCSDDDGSSVPSSVMLSGTVSYADKEYDVDGFTGRIGYYKAVRFAPVEAVDASDGSVLGSGETDSTGAYSIEFSYPGKGFYLRAIASTSSPAAPPVEVRNLSGQIHSFGSSTIYPSQEVMMKDIVVPSSSPASGAFNIYDVFISAGEFIESLEGALPPLLKAYWEDGNAWYGTYHCSVPDSLCPQGVGVYIYGGTSFGVGDTDEFDDDVLWHEYAHFVAGQFSRDDSPGGPHALSDNDLDLRLAWSEGWGQFFYAATKGWLGSRGEEYLSSTAATADTVYVDTVNSSTGITFDIATPISSMIYSSNEIAVANVLWRTMSETGDMASVWDVVAGYIPFDHSTSLPVNMEAFWDGWMETQVPTLSQYSSIEAIFSGREIDYVQDGYEVDDTSASAKSIAVGAAETRTIYSSYSSAGDIDFIAFDVNEGSDYTVKTLNLRNGTDTILRLFNPLMVPIGSNDNKSGISYGDCGLGCPANDGSTLASEYAFTAQTSGIYFVEVKSSATRPPSAGRYGSYTLRVTSP